MARHCWGDERKNDFGIWRFNKIKDNGLLWNMLPLIGFLMTYCMWIERNGKINWKAFTIKKVNSAWE